jgi:putative transposase
MRYIDYIHFNPVKHGYVEIASQWEFSSIHRYIQKGLFSKEWGTVLNVRFDEEFGEAGEMGCWASSLA